MSKQISRQKADLQIFYPMILKQMSEQETKEYHLKRLERLSIESIKSLRGIPELQEPVYEQKVWLVRRLRGSKKLVQMARNVR